MGGYGSGRWYRWDTRTTIDEVHCIDVRFMRRRGYLQPGSRGTLAWRCGEQKTGWIQFATAANRLVLHYRVRVCGGAWEAVEEAIGLDWTPCHYGGRRPWLRCPRCQRRVGVLCGAGTRFLCRHCYDLPYASQQTSFLDRRIAQAQKIRTRLGASPDLFAPLQPWNKPRGMHWRTFATLMAREQRYQHAVLEELQRQLSGRGT